jgi:hypothetical protein
LLGVASGENNSGYADSWCRTSRRAR